jgi:hypothetical protein
MLGDAAAAVPVMTTALGCLFAEPAKKATIWGSPLDLFETAR